MYLCPPGHLPPLDLSCPLLICISNHIFIPIARINQSVHCFYSNCILSFYHSCIAIGLSSEHTKYNKQKVQYQVCCAFKSVLLPTSFTSCSHVLERSYTTKNTQILTKYDIYFFYFSQNVEN